MTETASKSRLAWAQTLRSMPQRMVTTPFGTLLVTLVVVLNALLIVTAIVLTHYMKIDALSSLMYVPNEPCPTGYTNIGVHCFGDYTILSIYNGEANPWLIDKWNYLAAAMIPSYVFQVFGNVIGSTTTGTVLYVIAMAAVMTVPAVWASRGRPLWVKFVIWAAFGFLSVPALWALDRGNVVGWGVLGMAIMVIALTREETRASNVWSVVGLVLAVAIKPQFGLAIFVYLIYRRWRWFWIAAGSLLVSNVLAFLLFPRDFPRTILQALHGMFAWSDSIDATQVGTPESVAFSRGWYFVEAGVRRLMGLPDQGGWIQGHQFLTNAIVAGLIVLALVLARKVFSQAFSAALLFVAGSLVIPVSFAYYMISVLPLAAVVLRSGVTVESSDFVGELDRQPRGGWLLWLSRAFFVAVLAVSVSRVLLWVTPSLNWNVSGFDWLVHTNAPFLGLLWSVAIVWLSVATWAHSWRRLAA